MSTEISPQSRPQSQSMFTPLRALRDEFDRMFSRLASDWDGKGGWNDKGMLVQFNPACDLSESADSYQVRMDLPGLKPDEISVQVTGNSVRISGERKEEKEEKDKTFHRIERRQGSFCEVLRLPGAVSEDQVQAEFRDGVLTVKLPKSTATKTHTVKVTAGGRS